MNWMYCPYILIFIYVAPLFPNKLQQKPARKTLLFTYDVWSLWDFKIKTALWRPCSVWLERSSYLWCKYLFNAYYHCGLESQKNAQNNDISHYCVPIKITSGYSLNCGLVKNSLRYFYWGIDPTKFQVTVNIFNVGGIVYIYSYV